MKRFAVVMGAIALAAAAAWALTAYLKAGEPAITPAVANGRWLLVHGATLTLVSDPVLPKPVRREAACVKLPPATQFVTDRGDEILLLDPQNPSILFLSRPWLRQVAAGSEKCRAKDPSPLRRVPLHSGKLPSRATLAEDRLFVSFGRDNLVEEYTFVASHEGQAATALFVREMAFRTPETLGLGDIVQATHRFLVAARTRLYAIPNRNPLWPFVDTRTSNAGATRLYRHPSAEIWVIESGEGPNAYGSVQRVEEVDPPTLEAEVRLPVHAAPGAGYPLDADHFALLQTGGEHLFVFDARDGRLARMFRFDGAMLTEVARETETLPLGGGLMQLVADPDRAGEHWLVDRAHGKLVRLRSDGDQLLVIGPSVALLGPSWAIWL